MKRGLPRRRGKLYGIIYMAEDGLATRMVVLL